MDINAIIGISISVGGIAIVFTIGMILSKVDTKKDTKVYINPDANPYSSLASSHFYSPSCMLVNATKPSPRKRRFKH